MNTSDVEILCREDVRRAIDRNIERDPQLVALDKHIDHAALVATQVKYLQRARRKLPSLYDARCIIPPRAFEQSSSEECAERKPLTGDSVLDLTCGLGIDAIALARRFRRVVAVERDEALARVVRHNLTLLGISNVEVVNSTAEEYVSACNDHFDWIYADPDRRSDTGRKMVCLEDCSPDMLALMPHLRRLGERVAIKLSPLFDCDEAFTTPCMMLQTASTCPKFVNQCKPMSSRVNWLHKVTKIKLRRFSAVEIRCKIRRKIRN